MPLFLLIAAALADNPATLSKPADDAPTEEASEVVHGTVHIDAKLPAEVLIDGIKLAQVFAPGKVTFDVVPGQHLLRVYTHGKPHDLPMNITAGSDLSVVVGRTGLSSDEVVSDTTPAGIVPVEFRVLDGMASMIRIAGAKHTVPQGERLTVELPTGVHPISVRSSDGTIIWANGRLTLEGSDGVVVQVAEGRLPEVSGAARFDPTGG